MLVNQGVSAPWSSPFCWSDSRLHIAGFGSFHSPTLLTGFVGECSFVWEFRVSLENCVFDADRQTAHRLFPRAPYSVHHVGNSPQDLQAMIFANADGKIVPDGIAGKGDDLYVFSFHIRTQAHKPLHHSIDIHCLIYSGAVLINQNAMPLAKIIIDFLIENIFALLLLVF